MKRNLIFSALLALASGVSAQQAIWGVPQMISPEVNTDGTVTFRLDAPEASSVRVSGDFFAPADTVAPGVMARDENGIWTYTTPYAPAPELYTYRFMVDGRLFTDPSNVFQVRDVNTVMNLFHIPGGRSDLYKVAVVPHGRVSKVWYRTPSLGAERRITVYTPAGYEQSTERYPVFYLLHGMGGDENAWTELGRAAQILDNMIAAGDVAPMIVVMTNGNVDTQAAPGETSQGFAQPTTLLPHTMDGTFESHFPDVVAFVDSTYRTLPDKSNRAIAGLSMGGFHSMQISKEYPDMFGYVGLFSAAILPREGAVSPVYDDIDAKLARQFADAPALYWIAIGDKDFLYQANCDYRRRLDDAGYPYVYYESPDGHIWRNWRIYLTEFLPQLFKK